MKSKKFLSALLGLAIVGSCYTVPVMAQPVQLNDNPWVIVKETAPILRTSYNWTQNNIGLRAYSTVQFKGPQGNNYYFDTSTYIGRDSNIRISWSGAAKGVPFHFIATSMEDTSFKLYSGTCNDTNGSVAFYIPSNHVGNYKIEIHNDSDTNIIFNSVTLKTFY